MSVTVLAGMAKPIPGVFVLPGVAARPSSETGNKRLTSAAGEGAMAVNLVRKYLWG